jgi:hypothetical protein
MKPLTNIKLGIGMPLSFPYIYSDFFDSFMQLKRPSNWEFFRTTHGLINTMRNQLVVRAMQTGCSHLIMLDTDMIYHPDTIMKLLPQCTAEKPIIGALCYRRYEPFDPLLFRGKPGAYKTVVNWEPNKLIEVDATGTGCLVFHMSVFDVIPYPWFEFEFINPTAMRGSMIGEDIKFCSKVREKGFPIYVDPTVPSGHLTMWEVTHETFVMYKALEWAKKQGLEQGQKDNAQKMINEQLGSEYTGYVTTGYSGGADE